MRSLVTVIVLAFTLFISASAAAQEAPAKDAPTSSSSFHPKFDFVVGGLVSAGSAYAFSAWLSTGDCDRFEELCRTKGEMLIPFAGSMMHAVRLAAQPLPPETDLPLEAMFGSHGLRWIGVGILAVDSLVQVGGVVLATVGLVQGIPAKRPASAAALNKPTIRLTFGASQVGVQGTF